MSVRQVLHYFWGTVRRPSVTFAALAEKQSLFIGAAPMLAYMGLALVHNLIQALLFGELGTRPLLADPTFVGGFGYLRITLQEYLVWGSVFWVVLNPLLWVVLAGAAQVLARLWRGQGSFEANLNCLGYAFFVPLILIQSTSEWLFTIPPNLIVGTKFWWVEAMSGVYGPAVALVWNLFTIGIYSVATYTWILMLMVLAIRRTQGLGRLPATVTAVVPFVLALFLFATFVR